MAITEEVVGGERVGMVATGVGAVTFLRFFFVGPGADLDLYRSNRIHLSFPYTRLRRNSWVPAQGGTSIPRSLS